MGVRNLLQNSTRTKKERLDEMKKMVGEIHTMIEILAAGQVIGRGGRGRTNVHGSKDEHGGTVDGNRVGEAEKPNSPILIGRVSNEIEGAMLEMKVENVEGVNQRSEFNK